MDLLDAGATAEGLGDGPHAARPRHVDPGPERTFARLARGQIRGLQARVAHLEGAQRLLQALLEGASDGHHLAHRLHLRGEPAVGLRKLLEGEAGHLRHDVVDGGLEAGRGLPRDVVADLVEGEAHGETRGDLGDGKARGLRRQRRGARHARIHLHDHHLARLRVDGELDVAASGIDADLPDDGDRRVAHHLVFLVGQRLGRRDGDGVARVYAHGIEVLDGADDDHVVRVVPHDLELVLLPAEHALLDEALVPRRLVEGPGHQRFELLGRVGDAAAGAAHGEARPDDGRDARVLHDPTGVLERAREPRERDLQPEPAHGLAEAVAIFRLEDRLEVRADQRRTPKRSSTPCSESSTARLSAVWPPSVGSTASGRSRSMIFSMVSTVMGST